MYQLTQHKFWGVLALIISIMFVAFMVTGCGGGNDDDDDDTVTTNDDDDDDDVGPPDAKDVTVDPAPGGGEIPSNTVFKLKFDAGVDAATVNGTAATGSGDAWEATVPGLAQGPGQSLNIGWTNRSGTAGSKAVGPYNIDDPDTDSSHNYNWYGRMMVPQMSIPRQSMRVVSGLTSTKLSQDPLS